MIRWDKIGETHVETLKAMLALAKIYQAIKKWPEGDRTFSKYVQLIKDKYGHDSPEAIEAMRQYAEFREMKSVENPGCGCIIA